MDIWFLGADIPLTKTITATSKEPYPNVKNFTSYHETVTTTSELFKAVQKHAAEDRCLLKGKLSRPLVNESRAGGTRTDDHTTWVCLDFDRFETPNIDDQLKAMGVGNVSYVLQYSSSHGLSENEGTISAHVFMLLDQAYPAPVLKAWLMEQNLTHFRDELRLARCKNTLSWPLDITTCQNDKLLYIAPPEFKGRKDPIKPSERIQFIKRKIDKIPANIIGERHIEALRKDEREVLNILRKAEGLEARRARTVWVGEKEVISKPTTGTVTGIKDCGEWVRLNINGGDSWAYCHPADNFELLYDFKTDYWYKTKEFLPGYYSDCKSAEQTHNSTPTDEGDLVLAFRDLATAHYYNGLWNPETKNLTLHRARNETQLDHWMRSHGRTIGDFIPIWEMEYNPRENWQVDPDEHRINTFMLSEYMKVQAKAHDFEKKCPKIAEIMQHMLGSRDTKCELFQHFMNWFACVFQRRHKPLTAWVLHGVEGTGKGSFANIIAGSLLGISNYTPVMADNLEDGFNSFLEGKLMIFVDEVDVNDFKEKGRVAAKLRNYITEPDITIRGMQSVARKVANYTSFIFSSNQPQPVRIPKTDRRYNVGNFQSEKLQPFDRKNVEAELMAFAEYLTNYKVDVRKADTVLDTEERRRIQSLDVKSSTQTIDAILHGDLGHLYGLKPDMTLIHETGIVNTFTMLAQSYTLLIDRILADFIEKGENKLMRDELRLILEYCVGKVPDTPNKFTSYLNHHGVETRRMRRDGQLIYGLEIPWVVEDWLMEEYERTSTGKSSKRIRRVK